MKKTVKEKALKRALSVLLVTTLIVPNAYRSTVVKAEEITFTIGDLKYKVVSATDKAVAVIGTEDTEITKVSIPETVSESNVEYRVTQIADRAFQNCRKINTLSFSENIEKIGNEAFLNDVSITDVKLPENIITIGYGAFGNCTGITEIMIPKSLEETAKTGGYTGVSNGAFRGCVNLSNIRFEEGTTKIAKSLFANCNGITGVTIPDSVTTIEDGAFTNCEKLETIAIPDSVTTIGASAFEKATGLKSVEFGESVKTIGNYAFKDCKALSAIDFSESIEEIGNEAFCNDSAIVQIELPKYIKKMGYGAFGNCTGITEIMIPKSLEETAKTGGYTGVSNGPFRGCVNLSDIRFEEGTTKIAKSLFANCNGITGVTIPDSVTTIEDGAFTNCEKLETIAIPDSVTTIGASAFEKATGLKSVEFGESVKTIGNYAFKDCKALSAIDFSESIEEIGNEAFCNDSAIVQIELPKYIKKMGYGAFGNCTGLKEIMIPKSLEETAQTGGYTGASNGAFRGCVNLGDIRFEEGTTKIAKSLFANCNGITGVTIPDSVTTIEDGAFTNCEKLETIAIPDSVTTIGASAFEKATGLKSVEFGESVKTIGNYAFKDCKALSVIDFSESIEEIGNEAFCNDSAIVQIELPKYIKKMGYGAFGNCTGITEIMIPKSLEETTQTGGYTGASNGPFRGCVNLGDIRFEEGTTKIAKSLFANCSQISGITIPDTVTSISDGAFTNCEKLETIAIPDSVTTIGASAFEKATGLKSVEFGESVKTIGNYAFKDCKALSAIDFSESIEEIGNEAFCNDSAIVQIELPKYIKKMGYGAFGNCTGLKEIMIPKSLEETTQTGGYTGASNGPFRGCVNLGDIRFEEGTTKIAKFLFANCSQISGITIPDTVTSIGDGAFSNCKKLTSADIPESVTSIGAYAFANCNNIVNISCLGVETIGSYAFYHTESLKNVYVGNNVKKMQSNSFDISDILSLNMAKYSTSMLTFIDNEQGVKFSDTNNNYSKDGIIRIEKSTYEIGSNNSNKSILLNINYELKQASLNDVEDLKLVVKLPEDSPLNGIKLDDEYLNAGDYKISNKKVITIPIRKNTGKCVIYTEPSSSGRINSYAKLEYKKSGVAGYDIIGAISEKYLSLSLENLDEVPFDDNAENAYIDIKGSGVAEKNVEIYVDDILATETIISKAGHYATKVALPNPSNYKKYDVKIVSESESGKSVSVTKKVTTIKNCPKLSSALLYIEAHEYEDGYKIFDLLNSDKIKYITFQPGKAYNFIIKYENRDEISHVYVISKRSGASKKLEAKWDDSKSAYVTTGFFDNNSRYVPGEISIQYTKKIKEVSTLGEDGQILLTDSDIANVPDEWKNATSEQIVDTDSDYEANINLASGNQINYKYDKLTLSEYAKELAGEAGINAVTTEGKTASASSVMKLSSKAYASVKSSAKSGNSDSVIETIYKATEFTEDVCEALEDIGFVEYATGEKDIMMMKTDVTADEIITYIVNPENADNNILKYTVGVARDKAGESICDIIGIDFDAAEYAVDNMTSTVDFGGELVDLFAAKASIMANPNLTSAQKAAKCAQLKKSANIALEKLMFTYLANGLGGAAAMMPGTGLGLAFLLMSLGIEHVVIPMIERGDFDEWLEGKISLEDLLLRWIIDPSGYVYEGVTTNRLSDVKTTIYYKESLDSEKEILWEASEYDQENPIITDDTGSYAWDVPEGFWRVKAEKEGYETAYTDWLEVPPVQTDVYIKMNRLEAPNVQKLYVYQSFAILEFDQYIDPENIMNVRLQDDSGNIIDADIFYDTSETDSEGKVYAKKYKIVYKHKTLNKGTNLKIYLSDMITNSAGKQLATRVVKGIVKDNISLECDDYLYLALGDSFNINFIADGIDRDNIVISTDNNSIVSISEVKQGNGSNEYSIEVKGMVLGDTNLNISIDDGSIEKNIQIYVAEMTESGKLDTPIAVVPVSEDFEPQTDIELETTAQQRDETTTQQSGGMEETGNIVEQETTKEISRPVSQVATEAQHNEQISKNETVTNKADVQIKSENTVNGNKLSAPKIKKIRKAKRSLVVFWKNVKGATGYQIQYATTKKIKKLKKVTVKGSNKKSAKIKKLKAKKKYYVRIRAYVLIGKKKYYSRWSKFKKQETK